MNRIGLVLRYCFILISFSLGCCLLSCIDVLASETATSSFRSSYDMIMKWVNFLIMILIFFKYGYNPFKDFIKLQKNDVEKQIDTLQAKNSKATIELEEAVELRKQSEQRLIKLKNRIVSEGEKKCQSIIEQSNIQSKIMLKNAQSKAESRLTEARKALRDEIIDIAINLAEKRIPNFIDTNYGNDLLDRYMKSI